MRIGEGWDVHALVEGRPLILGGIEIPYEKGLLGHSDADALLHAITDALLGAAGLGDIGTHFPGQLPWPSRARILRAAAAGGRGGRQDRLPARQRRLHRDRAGAQGAPYKAAMRLRIAQALGVDASQVNVKAKTAEKTGPVREGRSIEARAVALLMRC